MIEVDGNAQPGLAEEPLLTSANTMATEVHTRVRRPESRRQELLDAALRLYLDRGVSDSTVADVTEAAGAAKGTFYRYFPSKDHLLMALRDQFTDELLATVEARAEAAAEDGPWAQVEVLCRSLMAFGHEKAQVHDVLFRSGTFNIPDGETDPFESRIVLWMTDFIQAGVDNGTFDTDDPPLTAMLFFSALHGPAERAAHAGQIEHERLMRGVVELVCRALGKPKQQRPGRFRRAPLVSR